MDIEHFIDMPRAARRDEPQKEAQNRQIQIAGVDERCVREPASVLPNPHHRQAQVQQSPNERSVLYCPEVDVIPIRRRRNELLDMEVRLRDEIEAVAAKRRQLPPGGRLKDDYRFERAAADGTIQPVSFDDLFGRHDSLLLYSMMFGPDWDAPCPSCTAIVDGMNISARAIEETAAIAVVAAAPPIVSSFAAQLSSTSRAAASLPAWRSILAYEMVA